MPTFSLKQLASLVQGRILGDESTLISEALPQNDAIAGCVTLADSRMQVEKLANSPAAAVVVGEFYDNCSKPQLIVDDIHSAFSAIVRQFRGEVQLPHDQPHIDPSAIIDASSEVGVFSIIGPRVVVGRNCKIGQGTILHAGVVVMENCTLGESCELFPGAVLYPGTKLGNRVLIHANSVIGAYGFGYKQKKGRHERTAQLGWVEMGDDVEIGACTTIDRGTYGATRIGEGTKIDNLVQIGHNCHIGKHNLLCSQVGIAGSCTTGDYVVMAGQVGLADHLNIGEKAVLGAQSGHMHDVPSGEVVAGSPAAPIKQNMLVWATLPKLPEMRKEIRSLVNRVNLLEQIPSSANRNEAA